MGPSIWGCGKTDVNRGGTVTGNTLAGAHMGYGFAANGVEDWTVTRNVDHSTHSGVVATANCSGKIPAAPTGFLSSSVTGASTMQSDFVPNQQLEYLLGLSENPTAVAFKANNGMFVTAEDGGAQPLIANRRTAGLWERFYITYLSGDQVQLKSAANNMWVTAENQGALPLIAKRTTPSQWETFHLIHNADGTVSLKSEADDKYVTSNNGTAPPIANQSANNGWEHFTLYNNS